MPEIVPAKNPPSVDAIAAVQRFRIAELEAAGVQLSGHAFSQILFVQGAPSNPTLPNEPLAGQVGSALHASLDRLGYEPADWAAMLTYDAYAAPLPSDTLREAIAVLGPSTVVAIDETAAEALREAYAAELSELKTFEAACLAEGAEAYVLGMRAVYLGNFAQVLAANDARGKQRAWAILKRLAPLGEPY